MAHIGVWEWDLRTDGVRWCSTTAHAFGLTPETAPRTGRAFFALVHPEDRSALGERADRAIRDRTGLTTECRAISADGRLRWIQVHGRVAYDSDGQARRVLGVNI